MNDNTENPFEGAPVIFAYTRAMALADGVLVELKEARNFGFKLQVVCTERVWNSLIEGSTTLGELVRQGALLRAAYLAAKTAMATERAGVPVAQPDRLDFHVTDDEGKDVQLYMLIHPDDDGSMKPVATVMYPDED